MPEHTDEVEQPKGNPADRLTSPPGSPTYAQKLYAEVRALAEVNEKNRDPEVALLIIEKATDALKEFGNKNQPEKLQLKRWRSQAKSILAPETFKQLRERTEAQLLGTAWRSWIGKTVVLTVAVLVVLIGMAAYLRRNLTGNEQVAARNNPAEQPITSVSPPPVTPSPSAPSPSPISQLPTSFTSPVPEKPRGISIDSERLCVHYEKSSQFLEGKITIALGAIAFEGNPLRHFVTFIVTAPGHRAVRYTRKENGAQVIYNAGKKFEIFVASIDAINACFDVRQI